MTVNQATKLIWTVPLRQALTSIKLDDLKFLHVSHHDVRDDASPAFNKHGYQRPPDQTRFRGIANYYSENLNLVPPILISVRRESVRFDDDIRLAASLIAQGKFDELIRKFPQPVLSVIDGQHRRGGLMRLAEVRPEFKEREVPLSLYFHLSYEEETQMFNDVNSTQKKLPKALIETNKGGITDKDDKSHTQLIRLVAFSLARENNSVWHDLVNLTGSRVPNQPITMEGMRRACANMFPEPLYRRLEMAKLNMEVKDVAKLYWSIVVEYSPSAWNREPAEEQISDGDETVTVPIHYRIKDLVGLGSLARLGNDVITSCLDAHQSFGIDFEEAMRKKMLPLQKVDWKKDPRNMWMSGGAGWAGQPKLYADLYRAVFSNLDPNGDSLDY